MEFLKVANPCRNFNVLSMITIIDPRDSREKAAFVTITQCGTGQLVIADYKAKTFESHSLLADGGAWALMQLEDQSLLIGTCNKYGSVQRFNIKEGTWYPMLRVESEEYIWNFAQGADGNIYAGTWSGDRLLKYCPDTHTLDDLGKVSQTQENDYSRQVIATPSGDILISSGYACKNLTLYRVRTGCFERQFGRRDSNVFCVGEDYVCTSDGETLAFIDPDTGLALTDLVLTEKNFLEYEGPCSYANKMKKDYYMLARNYLVKHFGSKFGCSAAYLSTGEIIGVQGQEMFLLTPGEDVCHYFPIETLPPITFIHELITDEAGIIWGASSFGMTLFSYDPKTGEFSNTKAITQTGGEVYGMVAHDGKIYATAYAGGEHVLYDPALPWDARGGSNPQTLLSLYPAYNRPITKSKIDADGYIWSGWLADYGVRGFSISKWNTKTNQIDLFEDIVPKTSIFGMDVAGDYVWLTTHNHANGLPDADDTLSVCAIDKDGNLVFKQTFDSGVRLGRIAFAGRYGLVQAGQSLYRIDSVLITLEKIDTVTLLNCEETEVYCMIATDAQTIAVFDLEETVFIRPETGEVTARVKTPIGNAKDLFYHSVFAATMANGVLYASVGGDLYKLVP